MELKTVLLTAVNAVTPILLLILLGYWLKQIGFLNETFVKTGNKLVFNISLPAMLFVNIYDIEGFSLIRWDMVVYSVCAVTVLFVLGFLAAISATRIPDRRGVVMQCVFRSNFAIIGLPLASALGGAEAVASAAVISAFTIPFFNIFAVTSLTIFRKSEDGKGIDLAGIAKNILRNPLIIGVALGLAALLLRQLQQILFGHVAFSLSRDTKFLYTTANYLKAVTTPLALMVLGAQFEFTAVKGMFKEIAIATVGRIVAAPLIGIGLAVILSRYTSLLQCGPQDYPALVALFGSPVAISSAVMAQNMKNDGQLAAQLVVWTSLFSILTVFITICILMPAGLLNP